MSHHHQWLRRSAARAGARVMLLATAPGPVRRCQQHTAARASRRRSASRARAGARATLSAAQRCQSIAALSAQRCRGPRDALSDGQSPQAAWAAEPPREPIAQGSDGTPAVRVAGRASVNPPILVRVCALPALTPLSLHLQHLCHTHSTHTNTHTNTHTQHTQHTHFSVHFRAHAHPPAPNASHASLCPPGDRPYPHPTGPAPPRPAPEARQLPEAMVQ
jgi:hypothetical protein